jgi:hypothetical protein
MTASAAIGVAVLLFAFSAVTGPKRALASVAQAMAKVQNFHVRLDLRGGALRYEAWGRKGVGTRIEERMGDTLTTLIVDDGKTLRRYEPGQKLLRQGPTRLRTVFKQAAQFSATRMLTQAAKGRLFAGHEWLGEATAREVSRVRRNGVPQRRIHVDLKDGFFERMVIYADLETDRLTQANLYTDSESADEDPFARVFFEYPEKVDPSLFRLKAPKGARIAYQESGLLAP